MTLLLWRLTRQGCVRTDHAGSSLSPWSTPLLAALMRAELAAPVLRSVPMGAIEDIKKFAEKATGWRRPDARAIRGLIRDRQPRPFRFKDDGGVPNHPRWPLIHFRSAVRL